MTKQHACPQALWPARSPLFFVPLLCLTAACSTPGPTPSGAATSGNAATASSEPSGVAATVDTGATAATTMDEASQAARAAVEGLDRLPRDGAFYAAVKPAVGELLLSLAPAAERKGLLRELEGTIPGALEGLSRAIHRELGIDPARPVLVSAVAPDMARVNAAMDAIVGAKTEAAFTTATTSAGDLAVHYRFVLPLRGKADPRKAIRLVAKHLLQTEQVQPCPGAAGCAAFGSATPSAVAAGLRGSLAAYAGTDEVLIDVASPLFGKGSESGLWPLLATMRTATAGGPRGARCSALDGSAEATACIDADAMANLSVATAYGLITRAIGGGAVEPAARQRIAAQGRKEAAKAPRLAQPNRRLLDDGTLDVRAVDGRVRFRGSWALDPAVRESVAAAFPTARCVAHAGSELRAPLVALRDAFGGLGADFADPKARVRDVQEAGWGAWPVLFARTWPHFLGYEGLLSPEREAVKILDRAKLCISVQSERLVIETHVTPSH